VQDGGEGEAQRRREDGFDFSIHNFNFLSLTCSVSKSQRCSGILKSPVPSIDKNLFRYSVCVKRVINH
jgi:hypothetical protein